MEQKIHPDKNPSGDATQTKDTFKSREGTRSQGDHYEDIITAKCALKLSTNRKYKKFHISANNEKFKYFDDVVLETEKLNGKKETVAIQLKHFEKGGQLQMDSLSADKGDFSLIKYANHNEIEKTCDKLILFTNRTFWPGKKKCSLEFCLQNGQKFTLDLKFSKVEDPDDGCCYKIAIEAKETNTEEELAIFKKYELFFSKFYLYTNQKNATEMENALCCSFKSVFDCSDHVFEKYIAFIRNWNLQKGTKCKFTRDMMGNLMVLFLFGDNIRPIVPGSSTEKSKLLKEAISKFDISVVRNNNTKIEEMWGDVKILGQEDKDIRTLVRIYQLTGESDISLIDIDQSTRSKLLWLMNKAPLIINISANSVIWKVIDLFQRTNIVLVQENCSVFNSNCSILQSLADLQREQAIYRAIVNSFKVSLQGREELTLQFLLQLDIEFASFVTLDVLIEMTGEQIFVVGGEKEQLPPIHINRTISNLVDVDESQLYTKDFSNTINLLCAYPGMGKTTLAKSLKNNLSLNYWTIIIYPTDVSTYFLRLKSDEYEEFASYIAERKCKDNSIFEKEMIEMYQKRRSIMYIWDGLDELSDSNLEKALDIISKLSKEGFPQWLMSRTHLKKYLEEKFSVYAKTVKQLSDQQQDEYITKRLREKYPDKITEVIEKIRQIVQSDEILATPLQIYILTEVFYQDFEKYMQLLSNMFSIVHLYEYFVNEKFKIFLTEKARLLKSTDLLQNVSDQFIQNHVNMYETLALEIFFDKDDLKQIGCNTSFKEERPDSLGLYVTEDGSVTFFHPSLGEYFAAKYLFKKSREIIHLKHIIFKPRYKNIRFMFDLLMASRNPLHLAVLHKNLNAFEETKHLSNTKDEGGRTPLHLACSWGNSYPIFESSFKNNCYVIKDTCENRIEEETEEYRQIIMDLVKSCYSEEIDDIFQMSPLAYADITLSLFPIVLISKQHTIDLSKLSNFSDIPSVLYYSVMLDEPQVLSLSNKIPLITTEKDNNSLLHIAVKYSKLNSLRTLLQHQNHRETIVIPNKANILPIQTAFENKNLDILNLLVSSKEDILISACKYCQQEMIEFLLIPPYNFDINVEDEQGNTPLHVACEEGNEDMAKLLLRFGADRNKTNKRGETVIHIAAERGHVSLITLLTCEKNINIIDNNGFNPLYRACYNGDEKVIQLLLNLGAVVAAECLYVACLKGYKNISQVLIDHGVDFDIKSTKGLPLLHAACRHGFETVIDYLIDSELDVNSIDNDNSTPLHQACSNNCYKIVQQLIDHGADVNKLDRRCYSCYSPLHISCKNGSDKIVELLVKSNAQTTVQSENGVTPLYLACLHGRENVVKILLRNEIDRARMVNIALFDGSTPLFKAVQEGHECIVDLLIQSGARVNAATKNGATPLIKASSHGHERIVNLLLKSGARVDAARDDGGTPLHAASQEGHEGIVDLLIESGAQIDAATKNGETPLFVASLQGHERIVDLLINSGAQIDKARGGGETPLFIASFRGNERIVDLLIKSGAQIDYTTPLFVASQEGHARIADMLIKSGAQIDAAMKNGETPLLIASFKGHECIVDLLIKSGAQIDKAGVDGVTALFTASQEGHERIVDMLIESGAQINSALNNGATPLLMASQKGHAGIVDLLIESGAQINAAMDHGATPLSVASQNGHERIVDALIKSGAQIDAAANNGATPLYVASLEGHEGIVDLLIRSGAQIDAATNDGVKPLSIALQKGHGRILNLLIKSGAKITHSDSHK